jgi:hypothetical protein
MEYSADQVWAIAVRVDRENGGYVKLPVYAETLDVVKTEPNKVIVKEMIRNNYQPTEEEVSAGREVRRYFNTFTMKLLAGKINEFEQTALKIAQKDVFTGRDMYDFAVVSCLPDVARKDAARTELKREIYASEQLVGNVGDRVQGLITVISCRYNQNYNKFRVQARMGEAFVDFWYSQELEGELTIKGKIKAVRGDKTTQLNFVKKA